MKYLYIILFELILIGLVSCSDKDEPKESEYKFETLDKIIDGKIWLTTSRHFFASDGTEISYESAETVNRFPTGMQFFSCFTVNGGNLIDYYYIVVTNPWYFESEKYSFDRNTGVITLGNGNSTSDVPYAKILSVEENRIVLQGCYGAVLAENGELDYDSYILMEMTPVEDEELLAKLAKATIR